MHEKFGGYAKPWIVLALGGSHPSKDWPTDHWRSFLAMLRERYSGTVFVIGGSMQIGRAATLIDQTAGATAVNACDLDIVGAAALLKHADLFVGPDSGPMNLAAAVGTQAFGMFGATPVLTYSKFIRAILPDDGRTLMPDGMERISPDAVLRQVESYFSGRLHHDADARQLS
jgi:heptosyltransferase-2